MTRRKVYFFDDKSNKLYSTPEFNGDKYEFDYFRKKGDYCDKNFDEIIKEFNGVKSLEDFKKASDKVQSYYHSRIVEQVILPIEEVKKITYNDEIYMIDKNGNINLYNLQHIESEESEEEL